MYPFLRTVAESEGGAAQDVPLAPLLTDEEQVCECDQSDWGASILEVGRSRNEEVVELKKVSRSAL